MSELLYRPELPPVPNRLRRLPIQKGYPVPWFVSKINGVYDFRVAEQEKMLQAIYEKLCWTCGDKMGTHVVFTIGPMCSVNRISAEPPSHLECAEFGVRACPFLNQTQVKRRETNMPEESVAPPGVFIQRQPGVILTWVTKSYEVLQVEHGFMFSLGKPYSVKWWRDGRRATKSEIMDSFELGYPSLLDDAKSDGYEATKQIELGYKKAMELIPEDEVKPIIFGSAIKR